MNLFTRLSIVCAAALACAAGASAQDLGHKAPPQETPIVITNASIHPVSGPVIERGYIAFDKGVIVELGSGAGPSGAGWRVIDGAGRHVYPSLIAAGTALGLMEIGAIRQTIDLAELGGVTPEAQAAVAVNPDSTLIPVTRSNGVLLAATLPEEGTIAGRAAVLQLDGWTWADMALEPDAGLVLNWPNVRPVRSRFVQRSDEEQMADVKRQLATIEGVFDAARAYLDARAADATTPVDIRYEAMRPALERRRPVFIRAQELEQIQSASAWAAKRGLDAVIVGGRDAALCADLLKQNATSVILTGTFRMPRRDDSPYDEAFTLPAELEKAGVKWCLSTLGGTFETPHTRNLPYHAAMAVAYGLDRAVALRAITLSAAERLGVAARVGSLEKGKDATLIVTTGDPLEIPTKVEMAFIQGRSIDLADKHKALAEKYRAKYRQMGLIPARPEDQR